MLTECRTKIAHVKCQVKIKNDQYIEKPIHRKVLHLYKLWCVQRSFKWPFVKYLPNNKVQKVPKSMQTLAAPSGSDKLHLIHLILEDSFRQHSMIRQVPQNKGYCLVASKQQSTSRACSVMFMGISKHMKVIKGTECDLSLQNQFNICFHQKSLLWIFNKRYHNKWSLGTTLWIS